ncbi:MAG: hypothetical protein WC805_01745 [Patescibacteria group bacterium]|jgi:hypothetical protein
MENQYIVTRRRPWENTDGLYMDEEIILEAWLEAAETIEEALGRHCDVSCGVVNFNSGNFGRKVDKWPYWVANPLNTRIINLTPHEVTIMLQDGTGDGNYDGINPKGCLYPLHIPSTGAAARCESETIHSSFLRGTRIPLSRTVMGEISGLPEPEEGTVYIVSLTCAKKAWSQGRTDCFVTNETIRDKDNRIIGCQSLGASPEYKAEL